MRTAHIIALATAGFLYPPPRGVNGARSATAPTVGPDASLTSSAGCYRGHSIGRATHHGLPGTERVKSHVRTAHRLTNAGAAGRCVFAKGGADVYACRSQRTGVWGWGLDPNRASNVGNRASGSLVVG